MIPDRIPSVPVDPFAPTPFGQITPIPWDAFKAEMLELYAPTLRAPSTRRWMEHALRLLTELGIRSTAELDVALVSRLLGSRPISQSTYTTLNLLRRVNCIATYAVRTRRLAFSPFAVRPIRAWVRLAPLPGKRHLERLEVRRILDVMEKDVADRQGWAQYRARRLLALTAVCAYAGPRLGEATHLRLEDIHLAERWIHVVDRPEHRTKTRRDRIVPIAAALAAILEDWLAHRMDAPPGFNRPESPWVFPNLRTPTPWVSGSQGTAPLHRLKAVGRRAGVEVTFQKLRRTTATELIGRGASGIMAQRILGHTSLQTTDQFYIARNDLPNMLRAVDGFTY